MSREFIEVHYTRRDETHEQPIRDATYNINVWKDAKIHMPDGYFSWLAVPEYDESKPGYNKMLLECAFNLIKETTERAKLTRERPDRPETQSDFNECELIALRELGGMLQYLSNCTSWYKNKLMDYDYIELKRRMGVIMGYIETWHEHNEIYKEETK